MVGAYMQIRREAVLQTGLLDEAFFMYGEDLDWAKRIKAQPWTDAWVFLKHEDEGTGPKLAKRLAGFCK